jgi:hypothetical protein
MHDATAYLAELDGDIALLEQAGRQTTRLKSSVSALRKKLGTPVASRFAGLALPKSADR